MDDAYEDGVDDKDGRLRQHNDIGNGALHQTQAGRIVETTGLTGEGILHACPRPFPSRSQAVPRPCPKQLSGPSHVARRANGSQTVSRPCPGRSEDGLQRTHVGQERHGQCFGMAWETRLRMDWALPSPFPLPSHATLPH